MAEGGTTKTTRNDCGGAGSPAEVGEGVKGGDDGGCGLGEEEVPVEDGAVEAVLEGVGVAGLAAGAARGGHGNPFYG